MNSFLTPTIFAIIYFLFRFFEMRVILKENKPLKSLLRDSLLVYISVLVGEFFISQLGPIANGVAHQPSVFIGDPDF